VVLGMVQQTARSTSGNNSGVVVLCSYLPGRDAYMHASLIDWWRGALPHPARVSPVCSACRGTLFARSPLHLPLFLQHLALESSHMSAWYVVADYGPLDDGRPQRGYRAESNWPGYMPCCDTQSQCSVGRVKVGNVESSHLSRTHHLFHTHPHAPLFSILSRTERKGVLIARPAKISVRYSTKRFEQHRT